jgi:molybdopterin molybdotransferase
MITYEEALSVVLENTPLLKVESVALDELSGRVLAEDIKAPFDLPLFDNSAVDGYGVAVADVLDASDERPVKLPLTGVLRAGDAGQLNLAPANSMKILTGAVVPPGVEAVVMREYCQEIGSAVLVRRSASAGENIRPQGAEYRRGETILRRGLPVTPPVVGMIASLGLLQAKVYGLPAAAVISTGNEIVPPGVDLQPGQIYDSNSYALKAALRGFGVSEVAGYHAPEDEEKTEEALRAALAVCDLVVCAGGVSVGDFDFVTAACNKVGVRCKIWKVSIKPGKPVYFGTLNSGEKKKLIFGLPGNPVAALVTLHLFVRPALLKMTGMAPERAQPLLFHAVLEKDLRKRPNRMEFVRGVVRAEGGQLRVAPTTGQDSHMLGGLCNATCLIHFGKDESRLSAGDQVLVELLDWN